MVQLWRSRESSTLVSCLALNTLKTTSRSLAVTLELALAAALEHSYSHSSTFVIVEERVEVADASVVSHTWDMRYGLRRGGSGASLRHPEPFIASGRRGRAFNAVSPLDEGRTSGVLIS
ncbi:hypothetical protein MPTK1_2g23775 [Marchantia polymorpha subsp. ruderalis]